MAAPLSLSTVVVYSGFYLFVIFVSLGVACALYWVAELVEEHSKKTERALLLAAKLTVVLNLALILDGQPPLCCLIGAAAHVVYHIVLSSRLFPHNAFSDPIVLVAVACCLANSGMWLVYFWGTRYTSEYVASYMLVTSWVVPFVLSLCLAGGVESLPGGTSRSSLSGLSGSGVADRSRSRKNKI